MSTATPHPNGEAPSAIKAQLMEMAVPDLFHRHPFRLLELPVEASARDLTRRRQQMEQAARNQLLPPSGPSPLFPRAAPPDDHEARTAGHDLSDARRRLISELLWFWPLESGAHAADVPLRSLAAGDTSAATEAWTGLAGDGGSATQAAAAGHNMAVCALYAALEEKTSGSSHGVGEVHRAWRKVWEWWLPLCEEDHPVWARLRGRIMDMDDPSLKTGAAESLRRNLAVALILLALRKAVAFLEAGQPELARALMEQELPEEAAAALSEARQIAAAPVRESLKKLGEAAEKDARAEKRKGAAILEQFFVQAEPLLEKLDLLLPPEDPSRVNAHDAAALAGLNCQIAFGNETEEWSTCIPLLEKCRSLAAGQAANSRIEDNLNTVRSNAESEEVLKKCWFCGEQDAQNGKQMEVAMYGDVNKDWLLNRVTWRKAGVKVPRCADCAHVHAKADVGAGVGGGVFVIGAILGIVVGNMSTAGKGWLVVLAAAVVAAVVGTLVQSRMPKPRGKKRTHGSFPLIMKLQDQGWNIGDGPSTQ